MEYLIVTLAAVGGAAGGMGWAVLRLRTKEPLSDTLRRIVPFSGGPRPGKPR